MKRTNILLTLVASALITACGGGGGGGKAAEGGFQQELKPDIKISWQPNELIPNASGSRFESLSSKGVAIVDVTVMRGNLPLETGTGEKSEVYVSVLNSGVDARLYCFDEGNDKCKEKIKDVNGKDVEVLKPLGGMNVNLNNGQGSFAVTPVTGQTGYIDLRVSAAATKSSVSVKTVRIPVKYASSGNAYQLNINAPNVINPNVANKFSVTAFDEAGNPIANAEKNNLIITATNLNGVTLGSGASVGSSIMAKSENGTAVISLLAKETGFMKITAQADAADNNIENGIEQLIEATKVIQVDAGAIIPLEPINITTGALPNGAVDVAYDFTIPTTGVALASMTVVSGNVPPGLTLSLEGQLSGTPTLAGNYSFTVKATGVDGSVSVKTLTLNVVSGGLRLNPTAFANLQIPVEPACVSTSQAITVASANSGYTPKMPFKWHYDAGNVRTSIDVGTATTLRDANNHELTGLWITVTADTSQITMNGEACRGVTRPGGYGIILGVEDANGIKFETVMPLIISQAAEPEKPVEPVADLALGDAAVGTQYTASIPNATSVSGGNLPPGLDLVDDGLLQGTPTQKGSYAFVVTLQDGRTQQVTIKVVDGQVGGGNPITLDPATEGTSYNTSIAGASRIEGALPPTLTFSNGVISGTPNVGTAGKYSFIVHFSTGSKETASLTVNPIAELKLTAVVGETFNHTIKDAVSITGPLALLATKGIVANGGTLSGTPNEAGNYVLTATLAGGVKQSVTLTVSQPADGSNGGIGGSGGALGSATVGQPYTAVINALSLVGPIPDGLTFSGNQLSGTPTGLNLLPAYNFTAILSGDVEKAYTLVVKLPPISLSPAQVGVEYNATLLKAQSISAGSLPTGLTLSGTTLSGTPEVGSEGDYTFTITRTDGIQQDHDLTVNP